MKEDYQSKDESSRREGAKRYYKELMKLIALHYSCELTGALLGLYCSVCRQYN